MFRKYINTLQHDASDCAAAVISTILLTYKQEVSLMKIREMIGTDAYGTSLKGLVEGLKLLRFNVKAIRVEASDITKEITFPAIAHVSSKEGLNHFVVIHKIDKKRRFVIADPAKGVYYQAIEEFEAWFSGVLIVCSPKSDFEHQTLEKLDIQKMFKCLILPQRKLLIITILTSFLLIFMGLLSSLFSKVLMDEVIVFQLRSSMYVFLLVFTLIVLVQNLLSFFRQYVLLFLSRKIDIPLLLGYYNHVIHLPYFFFVTRKTGDVLTRFQDAMTIKEIITSFSISFVMDVFLSVISALILLKINFFLFIILLFIVNINIILIYFFKKSYKKLNYEQMEVSSLLNSHLIESIKNIETIKSMGAEISQINKLEKRYIQSLKVSYREGQLKNIQSLISKTIGSLGNLFFLGIGALFIIDQKMSIGDLLVFQTLSNYFTEPIQNLLTMQISFQEAQTAMSRLSEIMSLDIEDDNRQSVIRELSFKGDIIFDHVVFSYGSRQPVLNDFCCLFPRGKKIAIVGESGVGKSTIARLLMKFVKNKEGNILIDGINVGDIQTSILRHHIAYIPQTIELFTGTILDNLSLGNHKVTYEQMIRACRQTGADVFIEKLPNRYNSYIEEGGSNLSGGEKQRIAIARALLLNPEVILFDEATSNLDSFSEQRIHQLIFEKISDKTIIIIAHRLSTIVDCDIIYFMKEGRVIEQGTHEQLLQLNGYYATMIDLQRGSKKQPYSLCELKNSKVKEIKYE